MATQAVTVPGLLLDKVASFVEITSIATKRALDEVSVHRQNQKRAADLAPVVLNDLITLGVVDSAQKEAAAAMLGSHAETLNLLKVAAAKLTEFVKKATDLEKAAGAHGLGHGVDDPATAGKGGSGSGSGSADGYNSLTSPIVGEKTANVKESDRPLLALIGR